MTHPSFGRRLAAVFAVVVLVAGVPIGLLYLGRLDVLTRLHWRDLWVAPDGGAILLLVLTIAAWIAWLGIVVGLVVEFVGRLSGHSPHLRVPGVRWFRPAAAVLVASILGMTASAVMPAPAFAQAPPPAPVSAGWSDAPTGDTNRFVATSNTQAELVYHTVRPGDDLWSLAEHYLGDGSRWRTILDANDTAVFDPSAELPEGLVLAVPVPSDAQPDVPPAAPADAGSASTPAPPTSTVVVQPGDTLWDLAGTHLGDPARWPELYDANRDLIADPDLIHPGWTLRLPAAAATEAPASADDPAPTEVTASPDVQPADDGTVPGEALTGTDGDDMVPAEGVPPAVTPTETESPGQTPSPTAPAHTAPESPPTATTTPAPDEDAVPGEAIAQERQMVRAVIGPIGGGLATLLVGALWLRRRLAQRTLPVGRRLPRRPQDAARFEAALARQAAWARDADPSPLVGAATTPAGDADDWTDNTAVPTDPDLAWALQGTLLWPSQTKPGDWFLAEAGTEPAMAAAPAPSRWVSWDIAPDATPIASAVVVSPAAPGADEADAAMRDDLALAVVASPAPHVASPAAPGPLVVSLGADEADAAMRYDLADAGLFAVVGGDARNVVMAVASQLAMADPRTRAEVVLAGDTWSWLGTLTQGTAEILPDAPSGLLALRRELEARRRFLIPAGDTGVADLPAGVFCFDEPLEPADAATLDAATLAACRLTVVTPATTAPRDGVTLAVDAHGVARLPGGKAFTVQAITAQARTWMGQLIDTTAVPQGVPAEWWTPRARHTAGHDRPADQAEH